MTFVKTSLEMGLSLDLSQADRLGKLPFLTLTVYLFNKLLLIHWVPEQIAYNSPYRSGNSSI